MVFYLLIIQNIQTGHTLKEKSKQNVCRQEVLGSVLAELNKRCSFNCFSDGVCSLACHSKISHRCSTQQRSGDQPFVDDTETQCPETHSRVVIVTESSFRVTCIFYLSFIYIFYQVMLLLQITCPEGLVSLQLHKQLSWQKLIW